MKEKRFTTAVVIGVGNVLLADEGAGPRAVELLAERYGLPGGVECMDGGTAGLGLIEVMRGRDLVVIIDAVAADRPPGTVLKLSPDELDSAGELLSSAHQVGVAELLEVARFEGIGAEVVIIGIVPGEISPGTELSPEVVKRLPEAAATAAEALVDAGFEVKER
jgi:hydrogenase maturation protease